MALALKRLFPRITTNRSSSYALSNTEEACRDLEWFLSRYPLEISKSDLKQLTERSKRHVDRSVRVAQLMDGIRNPSNYETALPLRPYQAIVPELVLEQGMLLLCDDLGLGKTASGIGVLTQSVARPALVVTLTALTNQWKREIGRFTPLLKTHILSKATYYDLRTGGKPRHPDQLSLFSDFPDVIVCNYAKIAGWSEALSGVVKTVIFDEVQELRRDDSQRYAAAKAIAAGATYRVGLSATPIYNYGDEIFNILDVLYPDCLGEKHEFLREWCTAQTERSYAITDPAAFGSYLRERGLLLRRTVAEVGLQVPKATTIVHEISSDLSALHSVDSPAMELARFIMTEGETARGDKMRAAGEFDAMLRQATGIAKAPHVADFVRMLVETGEKVVLFGYHHAVYRIWMERLADLNPRQFTGDESAKQKQDAFDAFTNGDCRVLMMSLRSGAGLDGLQFVCRIAVFGELDWSPKVHEQCGGRIDRPGQDKPVLLYYLNSTDGSDPVVIDVLGVKNDQSDGILDPDNTDEDNLLDVKGEHVKKLAAAYLARHAQG